jgi:hypothetical protein
METATRAGDRAMPWNKGKLLGQKPPLKLKEIWAIRIRLQLDQRMRELALFNLAIDSKLRGCDLVGLRVHDVVQGSRVAPRAIVMQTKTQRPVQFEITEQTRDGSLAQGGASETGPVPLSEPRVEVASSLDSAVLPNRRGLGCVNWTGPRGIRHAFATPHESDADLPANKESPGRSTSSRPHQT